MRKKGVEKTGQYIGLRPILARFWDLRGGILGGESGNKADWAVHQGCGGCFLDHIVASGAENSIVTRSRADFGPIGKIVIFIFGKLYHKSATTVQGPACAPRAVAKFSPRCALGGYSGLSDSKRV